MLSGALGGSSGANFQLAGFFGEYTTVSSWPMHLSIEDRARRRWGGAQIHSAH
jgi:hypothetical protein